MGPFAAAALSFGASILGGHLSRETAKKERKNHFVNLRDSATRAGFNPLTALYATGGGGYGQYVGLISRNPLGDAMVAGSNAYTAGAARREQMAHDRSMQSNRFAQENSLQKMRQDAAIKLTRLQREAMPDAYSGYVDSIPVQYLTKKFTMPIDMAKRAGIEPNANLSAGEIAEIFGEAAEAVSAFSLQGQKSTYGTTVLGLTGGDVKNAVIPQPKKETFLTRIKKVLDENEKLFENNPGDQIQYNWSFGRLESKYK
jgi:hypothetical protein